jgi:hypothetical protein
MHYCIRIGGISLEEQRKNKGIQILPSLHQRLKIEAARNGVPIWLAFQQSVELWLVKHSQESSTQKTESDQFGVDLLPEDRRLVNAFLQLCKDESQVNVRRIVVMALEKYAENNEKGRTRSAVGRKRAKPRKE